MSVIPASRPADSGHAWSAQVQRPEHGRALAEEIPNAQLLFLDGMGHEHLPPHTLDIAVPAVLRHTT
jgi:hypothetical protein